MHLFYCENLGNDLATLSEEESRHCAKVMRMSPGNEIILVDGKGSFCYARLIDVNARAATASVTSREPEKDKRPFRLHMAVAPTKNIDRFEWFLEKATECGIDEITPIICAQSERAVVKPERLHKILMSAMKQSQRAYLPVLNEVVRFKDFMKLQYHSTRFIAHCEAGEKNPLRDAYMPGQDVVILIGPEGDFHASEISMAAASGYKAISLGSSRLRTETAALVACMEVNFINGLL
jgi:16S rRNA (uracil1498-N3)-methyltransferase